VVAQDAARVQELWANPDRVAASDLGWLEELVAAYPAAVPLWWLYVRAVQRAESPKFAQVLQRCAAISPDRSALMHWVEEPLIPQTKAAQPEPQAEVVKPEPQAEVPKPEPKVAKPEPKVAKPEPKIAKPEPKVVQPEPKVVKPEPEVPQSVPAQPKEIDLDSLPEKVRAQILRSRAIMAKIKGEEPAPAAAPVPAPALAPAQNPEPQPTAPALVESETPESPVLEEPLAKQDALPKPKPAAKAKQEVVPKPSIAAEAVSSAAEGLSPFAQFVTRLSNAAAGPKAEDLIDEFLSTNPRISPLDKRDKDAVAPVVQGESSPLVTGLVTETLARLYADQGHAAKAIQAYEILKLRVPEKSLIFAARIEALRNQ
jgi:hypothetical protein